MKLLVSLLAMGLMVGSLNAAVVFSDDFSGDLSQWTSDHSAIGPGVINASGQLEQTPPVGNSWPYLWDMAAISSTDFTASGTYSLSFSIKQDYRDYNYVVSATMPGGVKMAFGAWNNLGKVYFEGTEISTIANGCRATWTSFQMDLDGRDLEIFKNGTSIFSTTLSSDPDFATNSKISLYSKYGSVGPILWDNVELSYVPEPASLTLLGLGLFAAWRRKKA